MDWIRRYARIFACVTLFLGVMTAALITSPEVVLAASKTERKLETALKSAIDDYDNLEIQEAEKKLEDGIKLADKEGVKSPIVAKLHIMLGVVRHAATRDEPAAEKAFVAGLNIDYTTEIDPVYATPELTKIFAQAKAKVEPPVTSTPGELNHSVIKSADAGKPIPFRVVAPEGMDVYRVTLLYRRFGEEDFSRRDMEPAESTFTLMLEGKEVRTSQIDYFILAEDREGNIVSQIGSDAAPINFVVFGSGNTANPDPDPDPEVKGDPKHQWGFVSIFVGTGVGFLPSGSPTANPGTEIDPGFTPTIAHVLLDFGVRITDAAHLGIYFRWQFLPSQDFTDIVIEEGSFPTTEEECLGLGLPGDCLLGLKYKWFFIPEGTVRAYSSIGTGVGRVRNWLQLRENATSSLCAGREILANPDGPDYCYIRDTVRSGWFHAGIGGGVAIPLTDNLDFQADSYLMFFLPDTSINLDVQAGFNFRF